MTADYVGATGFFAFLVWISILIKPLYASSLAAKRFLKGGMMIMDDFSGFDLNPANQLPSYERPPSNLLSKSLLFKMEPSKGLTAEKIKNLAANEMRYNQARDGLLFAKVNIGILAGMESVRRLKRGSDVSLTIYRGGKRHDFSGTIKSIYRRNGWARLKIQTRHQTE